MLWGRENNSPSALLSYWLKLLHPGDKRLTREKETSLLTCILHIYMEDPQEKWVAPQDGPSHHLSKHLQLKTEEMLGVGLVGGMASYGRKSMVNKGKVCYADFKFLPSPLISFL